MYLNVICEFTRGGLAKPLFDNLWKQKGPMVSTPIYF